MQSEILRKQAHLKQECFHQISQTIDGKHEIVFLNPNDPSYKAPTEA
jgi:hypothetical protein